MIHSSVIDDVPVRWTDQPGRFGASLVFRVGVRDETFATAGITHLVEHLAFSGAPVPNHDSNGEVSLGITEFTFEGTPLEVAESVNAVCESLDALASGRVDGSMLAKELNILEAEGETFPLPPEMAEALTNHYGLSGPGMASADEKYLDRLGAEDVARHAATYFTRGNAILVCTAEPPANLRLPLPDGPRRPLSPANRVGAPGPAEYVSGGTELVISFRIPGGNDGAIGVDHLVQQSLERRIHEGLRREHGLVYGADCSSVTVDDKSALLVAKINVAPRNVAKAAGHVIDELRALRDTGLTAEELSRFAANLSSDRAEPGAEQTEAYQWAVSELCGQRPWFWKDFAESLDTYTPEQTAKFLAGLESTLLVGLPEEALPEEVDERTGVVFPPRRSETKTGLQGEVYKRGFLARFAGAPADARLVVGQTGIELTLFGETTAVHWEGIVGMESGMFDGGPEMITLYTHDAFQLEFLSAWFRRGKVAVSRIRAAVPDHLQRIVPAEID